MAYPDRGLMKAAMGHYLTESARTALEALEPDEDVIDAGPGKEMPAVGPNQLLEMPLFTKIPFLPGSNTMFYRGNLGEKLYQPSATFDLNDPYCKLMSPKYKSLHDPHLRAYYKRKDNLRRLKKAGHITDKNKVVCTLKEFNEYRQYLTSLKLEFEKNYIREQKMLEKQVTKLQEACQLPEAVDTSKYRDWMLKEERPTIQEQENVMRNRYLELINQELAKLEQLAEENQRLALDQDDKKKQGLEKRKQLLLRKKMEEEWKKKEMMLLMKIGDDVKREARLEEQRRKSKEDKLKRKQNMLEKKMAYHLKKLQQRFPKEGFLPPERMFSADAPEEQEVKKKGSLPKKGLSDSNKSADLEKKSIASDDKGLELPKDGITRPGGPGKGRTHSKPSLATLTAQESLEPLGSKSRESVEPATVASSRDLRKENWDSEQGDSIPPVGKVSFASTKEIVSMGSNENQVVGLGSGGRNSPPKATGSASGGYISMDGGESAVDGSKTSCGGPGGCGSKTSCGGPGGCGSKTSCCGSGGCGSKTSCCGSGGCGSKTSCCGSGGCGSKTSCCGSGGCGSKTSCCGSGGCRSNNGKANGGYDSSGSSRHGGTSKDTFLSGADQSHQTAAKTSTKTTTSSAISQQTTSERSGKAKQKKRATLMFCQSEAESQPKDRSSSKKRRVEKGKADHPTSTSQDNEDSESSYSAYLQRLLSNSDQSAIRESLKGKVSAPELNGIIQNIMTWVVSAVTSILYPALTKFEERVRTRVYTISEESGLSSDNSSSCSTCNEDLYETCGSLPSGSTRKVSFTDTSIKPTTMSIPSEFRSISGKPTSLLSSKSSFTSFTKSTHMSLDSDALKGKFKRGKTAVYLSPSKYSGLFSTTSSMRSSKSDSHISQLQKDAAGASEKPPIPHHGKCKRRSKGLLPKTEANTTDTEGVPFGGGEHKLPHGPQEPCEPISLRDLKCVFADLKSHLTQITAIILDDIFKRILGDLGFPTCSVSISMEVLLESISESLLGSHPGGPPDSGSVSRIASFVANDIVESVLCKLHSATQKKYSETVSREDFSAGCKAVVASGKHGVPDPAFWRTRMPLSFETVYGIAEEIVHIVIDKLKVFATSSQTKLSQFELCAKIKAIGIPLEQLYAAIPPHTVESEAATAIVKDTIRKIVSKTIASSETNILQYAEEMISSIMNFIQRRASQEGILPRRESSIILQLVNDVFNDLSLEKLWGASAPAKSRASSEAPGERSSHETSKSRPTTAADEKRMRKPYPLVPVPGMVIYSESAVEGKEKTEPDGTFSTVNKERKVLVTEGSQEKVRYESYGLESRQRSRPSSKSSHEEGEKGREAETKGLERTKGSVENFVQEAILCSIEGQQTVQYPADQVPGSAQAAADGGWTLEQALKKMEEDFKEGEQSPITQIVRNLLHEVLQHIWTEQPIWPPAVPPPSLTHLGKHQPEQAPVSKGQFSAQPPISDAEVSAFAGELVKTVFHKFSCATLADSHGIRGRRSSLTITDIFSLQSPAEGGKSHLAVHFRDPELCSGLPTEDPQAAAAAATTTEGPPKSKQPELDSFPPKGELVSDLVQTFMAKLEAFVTSKVESQFCLDVQNLKMITGADFSSTIHQDLRRLLASQHSSLPRYLGDIFNAYNNTILAEKEKTEQALPLSYPHFKTYAQEVARTMLQNLKHGLDKEVEKILISPVIFSESIAASQIVNMVLAVFAPPTSQRPCSRQESVLEKLFRKNPAYKREIQRQIHNTVEGFLNEIYQTILLGSSALSGPEKFHTPGVGESRVSDAAAHATKKDLSKTAVPPSDVSLVSGDLVDVVIEDLGSSLAAGMKMKGGLSARLQSLLYNLLQKTVQPFVDPTGRHHHTPGLSKAEKAFGRKMEELGAKQFSDLREFSSEVMAKYLVDSVFHRLELFAEDKMESELTQRDKQALLDGGYPVPPHSGSLFSREPPNIHGALGQRSAGIKAASYREHARVAMQDSQYNMRLCAEKLTCTILKLVQKDLEREMLSCQNILPYEENASANEIVNDLLKILTVQIALTENEIQKRVLKRIFRKKTPGQKGSSPLLARVEDVLNQVTQKMVDNLGQLPSLNDSVFFSSESKSSASNGAMETLSHAQAGEVAGDIVDDVLTKMYTVVVDTLFSSSESKSEIDSSTSLFSPDTGKSDIRKLTMAVSQLQPPPRTLGEEMVQNVLNKIASFAASNLEEILPSTMQKRKPPTAFQYDLQAGDGTVSRSRAFSDDSESSLMRVNLSKSNLTVYAKDVVRRVLGTVIDDLKTEDYHRTILRVNTLSSEQINIASELVHSVVRDLHTDDPQISHLHQHTSVRRSRADGLPSTQVFLQFESTTKDSRAKPKCLFYDEFRAYLKQVLPKEGILRDIFERQPLTDANINENLKMLQVAENVVSEVFMRVRDLESSICLLKKTGELSERLFCYSFKRAVSPGLFYSDSQAEIGSVARDIVASVFENVHKCLAHSVPPERDAFPLKKDGSIFKGCTRIKHRFTQPEFPFYNISLKGSMDIIDKIAKETVECIMLTLETFVVRHFRRDFKCNFLEIVKFPIESLSFAQLTRSLDSLPTQAGNAAETFRNKMSGTTCKEGLPTLGSVHNFPDASKLGSAITKECIENAIRQVQMLHSELSVYANNAVSGILEIIKRTLDKELNQKEAHLFSSSSESLVLSETISVMLDRCNESLTEITSELMVENLQLEMSGRGTVKEKTLIQELVTPPGVKTTSKRYRRIDTRDRFPPINVPGMVIYSEEETEMQDDVPSKFPSVFKLSESDAHAASERYKGRSGSILAQRSRPPGRRRQDRGSRKFKLDLLDDDWLPRQGSIPEGSILEKLFKKTADHEAIPRLAGTRPPKKAGLVPYDPFPRGPPLTIPENVCYSAICPLKLGQTAETIVNTLLCEFGLEAEPVVQTSCYEQVKHVFPPKERPPVGSSMFAEPSSSHSLLNRWEKRISHSSSSGENNLLAHEGSSLLSKWESKHCIFKSKSPDRLKDLELLACAHVPDPCEIQRLANHIVLSVIKELITFRPKDSLASLPTWRQELIRSESKWLQERIWRSMYLPPPSRKTSSCLDLFWEPLTQAVVCSLVLSISNPSMRENAQERNDLFEGSLSMYCTVDACCPEHGLKSPRSPPINIEDIAFQISEVIISILCERNILQETINRKSSSGRRSKRIYVPPLCLANFDDVYHLLVKEVANLLFLEIETRSQPGSEGKTNDILAHQRLLSSSFTGASRGDCRSSRDVKGMTCLSMMGPMARKNQRLSCVASNLDNFIRSLKTAESKHIVNKVLHIILDSLWPDQSQGGFTGTFADSRSQNMMPYRDADLSTKKHLLSSSVCPHAYKLGNNVLSSNLGLSPKSVVLLDVVSEKLIRTLLDKCITTEHFTGTFAFDEFPEDEQIYDMKKEISDDELFRYTSQETRAHEVDSTASIFTYDVKYTEEPWEECQSVPSSYESALDVLAHTLVKPVMTELSLSIEHPRHVKAYSKKGVGFTHPSSRKARGQPFSKKHGRYGRSDAYCSLPRSKKLEPRGPVPGRRQYRKNTRERDKTVLETAMQYRTGGSKVAAPPTGRSIARKPVLASTSKKTYRKEITIMTGHGDQSQPPPTFSTVYSAIFLEEVISQLLIKIFSSICTKYDRNSCIDLNEMNRLFVNTLVEQFSKAGVGILRRAEEKAYFPLVDSRTIQKIVNSILQEFGFQLAADRHIGNDMDAMAERAAEIILMEILDYQLPPPVCRRLSQSAYKHLNAERIIQRIEHCMCFPKVQVKRKPPPTYVTVLSQKYLERVVNRLVNQLFPPCESPAGKQEKWEKPGVDSDELCSYMLNEVMSSISQHKIWVAKKDDRCRLHSEKEIQGMVNAVYKNMLKKCGSQLSIQKDVKCRNAAFVDSMTSFIIQEISKHHLQTFLSKDEHPPGSPSAEDLSENIVRTVLDSIGKPSAAHTGVFPAKFLEEIVSRVLSKVLCDSTDRKEGRAKGSLPCEDELAKVVKKLASSINLQFGKATVSRPPKGEDQSLGGPLTDVMDDVVDSVCKKISRERDLRSEHDFDYMKDRTLFENVKQLVGKGISDYLLHPLFSGDLPKASSSTLLREDDSENSGDEFKEIQESRSPFSTFLSSGLLKDIITGLLSKIFPSTLPREATSPSDKRLPSESELRRLSTQLLDDVRMKLLKHEIRVTKETLPEQYEYSDEDVQNMTDSLCTKIIQKSGSLEAVQSDVRNKSSFLINRIAGFLIGELLQKHVQPFVSGQESPTWDRAAAGDFMGRFEVYKSTIKPLDLRSEAQETRRSPSITNSLGEIIRELCCKLSDTLSDDPLGASGDDVGSTAVRLAKSLTKKLVKGQFSVQESPELDLGSAPEGEWKPLYKETPSDEDIEDERDTSSYQTATVQYEEPADHQLQSACPVNMAEAKCLIQKRLMVGPASPLMRAPVPYTTTLSYPVLEAIVDRLLVRVFPESSSAATGSGEKDGPFGSELRDKVAPIKKDIIATVLRQAIWISSYGNERETCISEEALESMVESVYCDVLHEVLLQQPLQEDRESLSNLYVTKIACFIINEMFKYHLQSLTLEKTPAPVSTSVSHLPVSCMTVFPCSLLEEMLKQLLMKIFPSPESIAAYTGSQADFSDSDFIEMAMNLKSYVINEISAHEIKLENVPERVPDMDQETEEDIASSVYNQILQKTDSQSQLQNTLANQGNAAVYEVANVLIREILNFHLHPFLSGNDSSDSESTPSQQVDQPFSHHIYSAGFLEDVVVAFFCKMLTSPNILACSQEFSLSENELRCLVLKLVHALINEFKAAGIKVIQSADEASPFPQVTTEDVIETASCIYQALLQTFGSEFDLFKAFQCNSYMLAEKLAPLIEREIAAYRFQPLFTGDTTPYLFSCLDMETIVDRVETILPETTTSPSNVFGEMFSKVLQRIFPSWVPRHSSESCVPEEHEPTVCKVERRRSPTKEEPSFEADKSITNLVKDIYKNICIKSLSPSRKYGNQEFSGFTSKSRDENRISESLRPSSQPNLPSVLASKTAGWTIHHVKLGEAESQPLQAEDGVDIYSSSFLKDIFSGLVSKLISSSTNVCVEEKKEAEAEPSIRNLVENILREFAKSPVKVMQIPEGGQALPAVDQCEVAKIVHAALCGILQEWGSRTPICRDKESDHALAERLASAIKKEILGYQIKGMAAKMPESPVSKPFEFGEMAKKVLMEVRKINTPCQTSTPYPLLVSQRIIHDILAALLAKILPLPTTASTSSDREDKCAEFDFIHMKLLSRVMAEIAKDKNTEVQYLEKCQPNYTVSQTVANSVYGNLLPEFGSTPAIEKCIKAGCTILAKRIADFVIKEISGNQMQTYFSDELTRQREAESEKSLEDEYGDIPETSQSGIALRSHLKGLSSIIIEEVAAKFLSKLFNALPLDDIDSRSISSMKEVARRIINSIQGLISKNKLKVWQQDNMEDLGSEDSRAVGEVVDSVYTDIIKHSSSDTSLYDDLTNENKDFVNRVACVMVSEIARHDFQPSSESEDEVSRPSTAIKLETDKIIQKFLSDMEAEKIRKQNSKASQAPEPSESQVPTVSVLFMEEVLSRLLTKILFALEDFGIITIKTLSRVDVNDIADQLKSSVEKEMSKNKINLVTANGQPTLDPQDEDKVNQVVHSVFSNVLNKSGSQQEMYEDITKSKGIFPEQVASIIINEISSCSISNPFAENIENETYSALELDRIVDKVLAQVSSSEGPEEYPSFPELSNLPYPQEEAFLSSEKLPKIVPYLGHTPLKIDPDIVSDHLAVISIKTEPLEKMKKTCLSRIGMSLTELRRASASGKSIAIDLKVPDLERKKERRPSLDMAGRLGVKPKEVVCRNSFQTLMKPDITKVELLKDVEDKQDLILRLVAHDIGDHFLPNYRKSDDSESEDEERVVREHRSFYFEGPSLNTVQDESMVSTDTPSKTLLARASSSLTRKRSLSLGKCCQALTSSSSSVDTAAPKGKMPPPPQIEIISMSSGSRAQSSRGDFPTAQTSPPTSTPQGTVPNTPHTTTSSGTIPSLPSSERAHPRKRKSEDKEKTLEEAVVDMHLSRDTEETSAALEITSFYQDQKIKDSLSEVITEENEGEDGEVIRTTSSDVVGPVRQRSSMLEKVSSALSRVFSRTSASNPSQTALAPERAPGDQE